MVLNTLYPVNFNIGPLLFLLHIYDIALMFKSQLCYEYDKIQVLIICHVSYSTHHPLPH